jgi:hypothetical protein
MKAIEFVKAWIISRHARHVRHASAQSTREGAVHEAHSGDQWLGQGSGPGRDSVPLESESEVGTELTFRQRLQAAYDDMDEWL